MTWFVDAWAIISQNPILSGIAVLAVGNLVALIARQFLRTKKIGWKLLYDSKLGLQPPLGDLQGNPEVIHFFERLKWVTVLVIKVTNTGRAVIEDGDYNEPLRIVFPGRFVLDFRVDHATPANLKPQIEAASFVSTIPGQNGVQPNSGISQGGLRQGLSDSLRADGLGDDAKIARQQLNLVLKTKLLRREGFTLLVDLRQFDTSPGQGLDAQKEVNGSGLLRNGFFADANSPVRRVSLTTYLLSGVFIALASVLIAVLVVVPQQRPDYCASGQIRIIGSSAFALTMDSIAKKYHGSCPEAVIQVQANGSLSGVRELESLPEDQRSTVAAVSDGVISSGRLRGVDMAVALYAVVVDSDIGIDRLSSEQVRGIYANKYKSWIELGSRTNLPIRVVGRGAESGSRRTFERYVLDDGQQPQLSSDACEKLDKPGPDGRVILCERADTAQVLNEIQKIPGAIGYAEASEAARFAGVSAISLDGSLPTVDYLSRGYNFWTIEYLYTFGDPAGETLLAKFKSFVGGPEAREALLEGTRRATVSPCRSESRAVEDLCRNPR